MKFKYLHLLLASVLFAACSLSPEAEPNAGSEDALEGAMVTKTLVQLPDAEIEVTLEGTMVIQTSTQQSDVGQSDAQPEDTLVVTIATQTSTQKAEDVQPEDTPQPEQQEPVGETPGVDVVPTAQILGIPGLNPLDLVDRLLGFGFDCSEPEIQGSQHIGHCSFETSEYQFSVTMWGSTPDTVDLIEAAAFYFGDLDYSNLTSVVFGMIVEIPYDGADPESARAWVEATIPDIQEIGDEALTDFGGVRYYLYAFPSAHVLEIGRLME